MTRRRRETYFYSTLPRAVQRSMLTHQISRVSTVSPVQSSQSFGRWIGTLSDVASSSSILDFPAVRLLFFLIFFHTSFFSIVVHNGQLLHNYTPQKGKCIRIALQNDKFHTFTLKMSSIFKSILLWKSGSFTVSDWPFQLAPCPLSARRMLRVQMVVS